MRQYVPFRSLITSIAKPLETIWLRNFRRDSLCLHLGAYTFEMEKISSGLYEVVAKVYLHGIYVQRITSDFHNFYYHARVFCTYYPNIRLFHIFCANGSYANLQFHTHRVCMEYNEYDVCIYDVDKAVIDVIDGIRIITGVVKYTYDIHGCLKDIYQSLPDNIDSQEELYIGMVYTICIDIMGKFYKPSDTAVLCEFVRRLNATVYPPTACIKW